MGIESKLRAEARVRHRRAQERLKKTPPQPNDTLLAQLGDSLRRSGQDNDAALAALAADPHSAINHLTAGYEASGETPAADNLRGLDAVDAFIDRVVADPTLEATLTAEQRIALGQRQAERERERLIAEEEANAGQQS